MEKVMNKIQDKCNNIEYGAVTVTFTIHNNEVVKIEYQTSEREVIKS